MAESSVRPFPDQPEVVGKFGTGEVAEEFSGYDPDEKDEQLLARVVRNLSDGYQYWNEIWDATEEDLQFIYVQQWTAEAIAERVAQKRPFLTLNHLPNHISIVTGAARQMRFAVKVRRKAGLNSVVMSERGRQYSSAEAIGGMIRDVERRSVSRDVYLGVLKHAVEGGFGHMALRKERPVDDPRHVELRIEHLVNRYSVVWDPFAERVDKSDARWVAVQYLMPRRDYSERYEDDSKEAGLLPNSYNTDASAQGFAQWWHNTDRDEVRIIEYWWKEPVADRVLLRLMTPEQPDPRGNVPPAVIDVWADEITEILDELTGEFGYKVVEELKFDSYHVMGAQLTGRRVLERPMRWEGNHLPVVTVPGRLVDYDGKRHHVGLVRYAKDACRMANYWSTAATERVAQAPKDEYVIGASQIEGREEDWQSGGAPKAARVYNDENPEQRPPARQQPPQLPNAELSLVSLALETIKDTIGLHDANLGRPGNEVSGRAINARQAQGQTATYEYIDNLAGGIQRMGTLIADIAPKITSPSKFQRLILADNSEAEVVLNQRFVDKDTGDAFLLAPLNFARYEVDIDTGPAYATQREEMWQNLTEMMKNAPQVVQPMLDLFFASMDLPYGDEMARRAKYLVPRHMLSEEDQETMPEPRPTPEQELEMQKAKAEQTKHEGMVANAEASVELGRQRIEEQDVRLQQQVQRLEQEKVQLEQEIVQLQQENAKLDRERQQIVAAEREAETERNVDREAKVKAAEAIDPKALP